MGKINKIEKRVGEMYSKEGTRTRVVFTKGVGELRKIEFWGNPRENLVAFIREIEAVQHEANPFMEKSGKLSMVER